MGKRLGQHFLYDAGWIERILAAADLGPQDRVLEIGPGRGALTLPMADKVSRVLAYELDPVLAAKLRHPRLEVRQQDILEADLGAALDPPGWKVVSNLPYYITTPILEKLLGSCDRISAMWLTMQHEVAQRIVSPATREAGSLTYFVGQFCEARYLFKIPPEAFHPAPEVHSAVLELRPRPGPCPRPLRLSRVVRGAFEQRRKTLRRSLHWLPAEVFATSGIDSGRRPETLTLEEFVQLEEAWWGWENQ